MRAAAYPVPVTACRETDNMSHSSRSLSTASTQDWNSRPPDSIKIAYRLYEVLEQTNRCAMPVGPRLSGSSLLSRLIKLHLIILLLIEVSVTFVIGSRSMPMVDRNPLPHHLSANRVRAPSTIPIAVAHRENGE